MAHLPEAADALPPDISAGQPDRETSTVSTLSDVDKSPAKYPNLQPPFAPGHDPRRGKGPPPGSGGRPPNAFKDFLRQMRENPKVQEHLQETLEGRGNKSAYAAALKLIADYDPELPSNLTPEERKKRVKEILLEGARRKKEAEGDAP